jgi:hypothetical protein
VELLLVILFGNAGSGTRSRAGRLAADQELLTLESMKMLTPVPAPAAGRVEEIAVAADDYVDEGGLLIRLGVAGVPLVADDPGAEVVWGARSQSMMRWWRRVAIIWRGGSLAESMWRADQP